jgi:exodeoxyribonuclease VII small subunit
VVPLQAGVKPPAMPAPASSPAPSRGSTGAARSAPPPEDDVPF